MGPERKGAECAGAEPVRRLHRRERADHARIGTSAVAQRKDDYFEVEGAASRPLVGDTLTTRAQHHADRLLGDDGEDITDQILVLRRPEIDECLAFELAPEGGADARAGDAERMPGASIERQHEGVGKDAADGSGLDVATLRRRPQTAALIPIFEQFTNR